ncbi:MAG: beta-ketoacyl-ACP synthase II [Candidatus Brocadiae bacterium]|nr:beta-ketoacyl-ACP synthase II [Candidatus Brocadiia bacterium]
MNVRRVVVTGIGVISPVGSSEDTVWPAVRDGRSGIGTIASFDTSEFDVHIAGEVVDFDPLDHFGKRELGRLDRFVQFAVVAADSAIAEAGLDLDTVDRERAGAFIGTGIGGLHTIEAQHTRLMQSGPNRTSPVMIPKLMTNAAAGRVAMKNRLYGPSMSVSSACASASHAIGEAFHCVRFGMADVLICGGAEAAVTPMGLSGFQQARALSTRNDDPPAASRPFDLNRDGFVMAEGAAVLVLESLEHARRRGAAIHAEIAGYGASSDAYHITLPEPDGKGAALAMANALADAQIDPERIDYINAHGTGTPAGDDVEAKAVCAIFGEHTKKLAVSSSKSVFGHLLGASGALESAVCLWAMRDNVCPPTINLDDPDPECCGLNFVPREAQQRQINAVLNNSFGFGGHNVSLVFRRFTG